MIPASTSLRLRADLRIFPVNASVLYPGTSNCGCVDALPHQLPYVRSGHVQLLLSQDCYGYGFKALEHLVNKLHLKKEPASPLDNSPLTPVGRENVEAFAKNWEKWLPK